MSIWLLSALIAVGGVLVGVGITMLAVRGVASRRITRLTVGVEPDALRGRELAGTTIEISPQASQHALTLIDAAFREPIARLRRATEPLPETVEQFGRLARQVRLLVSSRRPMRAAPASPISLLEESAEQVSLLRLGKVPVSWTLRNRQPVQVDADRARAAFVELLAASAEAAGEGGRLGIKILPGPDSRYPVRIEIEVGRRGAVPDALAVLVARHLLEAQGARTQEDGPITRIDLRGDSP